MTHGVLPLGRTPPPPLRESVHPFVRFFSGLCVLPVSLCVRLPGQLSAGTSGIAERVRLSRGQWPWWCCRGGGSAAADTSSDNSKNRTSSDASLTVFRAPSVHDLTDSSERTTGWSFTDVPKMANEGILPRILREAQPSAMCFYVTSGSFFFFEPEANT